MIIGICRGRRAIAPSRMNSGLSFHNRTMLTLAGNTDTNNATAASAPRRRVFGASNNAPVAISPTPEA